jgi:hypothetical protein
MSDATAVGITIYDQWAAMWSGTLSVDAVMAASFRLRYAQVGGEIFNEIRDVERFAAAVVVFRAERPGIQFASEGTAVVNMDNDGTGMVARPYLATIPAPDGGEPVKVSGTDILRCEKGLIVEVWSVSARGVPFYA